MLLDRAVQKLTINLCIIKPVHYTKMPMLLKAPDCCSFLFFLCLMKMVRDFFYITISSSLLLFEKSVINKYG